MSNNGMYASRPLKSSLWWSHWNVSYIYNAMAMHSLSAHENNNYPKDGEPHNVILLYITHIIRID